MSQFAEGITALGVRRPILILVVNLLILLAGLAAIMGVDVRELPDVDRPVISVRANFIGASPYTMDAEVTSIVEGAVARVAGVQSIKSSSEENNMRIRVEFAPGVDLNVAANDIREAVARVQRQLPDAVEQLLVIKADADAQPIIQLSAYSDSLTKSQLAERIDKDVAPMLLAIAGVADVQLNGDQPTVLRVLVDPLRLAAYQLDVADVIAVLRDARLDVPAGSYKSEGQDLIVRAYATVVEPEQIKQLPLREQLKLGDIAEVFYAPQQAESYSLLNGRMVIGLDIVRQAGSNTIDISNQVQQRLQQINLRARDFQVVTTSDDARYITGALSEVVTTLVISVVIVLVVIAVFLGHWRATLVPAVTMPISLIGTLAVIWLCGFSINLLTLLALVLATGLIVDDAIVVLENIQRLRAKGQAGMAAAVLGTKQVFFAVIATTITLVSVFLPIAFLPGEAGRMFQEFGLVLAIAVIISSFVAVSLCPMMASRLPDERDYTEGVLRHKLRQLGGGLSACYLASLNRVLAYPWLALLAALLVAAAGVWGFTQLNQQLLPQEDRGQIRIMLTGPDGASLAYSDEQARKVEQLLYPYQQQGLIDDVFAIVGRWDKNRVFITATMKDWSERDMTQMELVKQLNHSLKAVSGAQLRVIQGNSLNMRGAGGGGIEIALLGNDYQTLLTASRQLGEVLQQQLPEINDVRIQFDTSQPEMSFNIDRERAHQLNVPLDRISETLRVMVDRYDVIDLSVNDRAVPVMLGPAEMTIASASDLLQLYVRNTQGQLVSLAALVDVVEQGVAAELDRHAQRRAIELDLGTEPDVPLGQLVAQVRQLADDTLPPEVNIIFLGEAATLQESSYAVAITFVIALLVVFLVLAAQFESFGSAVIVVVTVPFGLAAAIFALLLTGQSINLYSQIGLVMLIGLMTKNAILLVEFMDQLRDAGHTVAEAVIEGVKVRLRPVVMTVLSTVMGALPLILSSGPGAEARAAIGWVIFGGLGLSAVFTLYLVPVGYALIAPHLKARAQAGRELDVQLQQAQGGRL